MRSNNTSKLGCSRNALGSSPLEYFPKGRRRLVHSNWQSQWHAGSARQDQQLLSGAELIQRFCTRDELDEVVVRLEAAQLLDQLLHRVDVVHRAERAPEHGHRVQRVRVE